MKDHSDETDPGGGFHFFPKKCSVVVMDDGLAYCGRVVTVYQDVANGTYYYDCEFRDDGGEFEQDKTVFDASFPLCRTSNMFSAFSRSMRSMCEARKRLAVAPPSTNRAARL